MSEIVTISHVGQNADGIATLKNGDTLYVPYALSGEKISVALGKKKGRGITASIEKILSPSIDRIEAPCPYYGQCGGCSAQHMSEKFYTAWKKDIVQISLNRHGITNKIVEEPLILPQSIRRRTNLKALKFKNKLSFGYRQKAKHDIINIDNCLILRPELVQLFPALKRLFFDFLSHKEMADIWLSITNQQIDLYIDMPQHNTLSYEERETLANFAKKHALAKLTVKINHFEDPIYAETQPTVLFSDIPVTTGAKNFLQASDEADKIITQQILQRLDGQKIHKIADLFCGRGTFSFAFHSNIQVDGYEADKLALSALNKASHSHKKNVKGLYKNLFSDPLTVEELNLYDAIILDPPREGAKEQIENLSKSNISYIIYISCSPNSFARDAEILIKKGYQLNKITPIDQFLWSNHIEVIALFEK